MSNVCDTEEKARVEDGLTMRERRYLRHENRLKETLEKVDVGGLWLKVWWNYPRVFGEYGVGLSGWVLSLTYEEVDIETGIIEKQTTRGWFVAFDASPNEILRTVRKLLLGSMEHRVDEHFLFEGKRVYDPHREVV